MEYDKSRVYTALNADELKPGSKVVVADNIATLESKVREGDNVQLLVGINNPNESARFLASVCPDKRLGTTWLFAYLVEPPDEPTVTNREFVEWLAKGKGQYTTKQLHMVSTNYMYELDKDNDLIPLSVKVRRWGDDEWHTATKEYLGEGK